MEATDTNPEEAKILELKCRQKKLMNEMKLEFKNFKCLFLN
jgi:hypothetical protein